MFIVKGFKNVKDAKSGIFNTLFESENLKECAEFAYDYSKKVEGTQVDLYRYSNRELMFSIRNGVRYKFNNKNELPCKELIRLVGKLVKVLEDEGLDLIDVLKLTLLEENGSTVIKDDFSNEVLMKDILESDSYPNSLKYYIESIIELFHRFIGIGVKKFTFVLDTSNVEYYFFTDSVTEKGSVDVYLCNL